MSGVSERTVGGRRRPREMRRAHHRHELDAGGGLPAARRPRGAAARQHRAAQPPAAHGRLHPARARGGRRRRAARRAGVSGGAVRRHAVLPRVPRLDLAQGRDAPARRRRHPRRPGAQRLPPHPDRQRPRRQQRRAAVRAGVGRRSPRLPRALPQLVERAAHLGQGAGDRSGGVARLVDGELPVDAPPRRGRCRTTQRPMVDLARVRALDPVALRSYLGDGNFGGLYQRSDDEMLALWEIAVDETRALLTGSWGDAVRRREADRRMRCARSGARARLAGRSARISRAPAHDVTLVDTVAEHVDAINRDGLRDHRADRRVHRARARLHAADAHRHVGPDRPRHEGASHRAPPSARSLPHLTAGGCVVSAQNGLNELAIARGRGRRAHGRRVRQLRRRLPGARRDSLRRPRRRGRRRDRRPRSRRASTAIRDAWRRLRRRARS